jgi:thioredoxin-related protein
MKSILNKKRVFGWAKTAAIYGAILFSIGLWQNRNLLPTGNESFAPGYDLPTLDNPELIHIGHQDNIHQKNIQPKTILFFFAPWCTVCSLNADNINMLLKTNNNTQEVRILAVALAYESIETVRQYVRDHDLNVPVLLGTDQLQEAYKISAFPTFYILDERGAIKHQATGYTTFLGLLARKLF